jgi:hypothetical protein
MEGLPKLRWHVDVGHGLTFTQVGIQPTRSPSIWRAPTDAAMVNATAGLRWRLRRVASQSGQRKLSDVQMRVKYAFHDSFLREACKHRFRLEAASRSLLLALVLWLRLGQS